MPSLGHVGGLIAASGLVACSGSTGLPGATRTAISPPAASSPVPSPPAESTPAIASGGGTGTGNGLTELDITSDGRSPVTIGGTVSGAGCSAGGQIDVHLEISVTRGGRPLPGGGDLALSACGPFSRNLQPDAGPVHVRVVSRSSGDLAVQVNVSSAGSGGQSSSSSSTSVSNGGP